MVAVMQQQHMVAIMQQQQQQQMMMMIMNLHGHHGHRAHNAHRGQGYLPLPVSGYRYGYVRLAMPQYQPDYYNSLPRSGTRMTTCSATTPMPVPWCEAWSAVACWCSLEKLSQTTWRREGAQVVWGDHHVWMEEYTWKQASIIHKRHHFPLLNFLSPFSIFFCRLFSPVHFFFLIWLMQDLLDVCVSVRLCVCVCVCVCVFFQPLLLLILFICLHFAGLCFWEDM